MENDSPDNATAVPTLPSAVPVVRPTGIHHRKPDPAALPIVVKGHYDCNLCYRDPFNTQAALWHHQIILHWPDNKFRCPNSNCKLLFPINVVKNDHVKRHKIKGDIPTLSQSGAERMCMPFIPSVDQFIDALKETALANKRWIPSAEKANLYIRPLLGTGHILGLAPSPEYASLFYASPVSNYFKEGLSPLNLYLEDEFRRATGVGAGGVKSITNYALVAWNESEFLQHLKRVSSRQVEHVMPPLLLPYCIKHHIRKSRINLRSQNDEVHDLPFHILGLRNSFVGNLKPSTTSCCCLPAGIQESKQIQLLGSRLSNMIDEKSNQIFVVDTCGKNMNMRKKVKSLSNELNIQSSHSEILSPDSQSSVYLFGTEIVGKEGCVSSEKAGLSSIKLFGKTIHVKDSAESNSDDTFSVEGNGNKTIGEAESVKISLGFSSTVGESENSRYIAILQVVIRSMKQVENYLKIYGYFLISILKASSSSGRIFDRLESALNCSKEVIPDGRNNCKISDSKKSHHQNRLLIFLSIGF